MKLIWMGHSSFRLEIGGLILLIDPWLTGNPVLPEDRHGEAIAGATHILLTHAHFDHAGDTVDLAKRLGVPVVGQYDLMSFWGENQGIKTVGFNKGGTVDLGGDGGGVHVSMVNATHSSSFATPDGPRTGGSECGFIIKGEGDTIYVSGDTDIMADMDWIGAYCQPDTGILCAGGHFTMDMAKVAWAAQKYFDFKTIVPCHYKTFPILEQSADALIASLPGTKVIEPEIMTAIEL
ncbi:MAG: metal-dependent hydrolase [Rhodobacteraceae bacterium]|nr:metal-dependent hydrolase [Paracoccaceae bacterium]